VSKVSASAVAVAAVEASTPISGLTQIGNTTVGFEVVLFVEFGNVVPILVLVDKLGNVNP